MLLVQELLDGARRWCGLDDFGDMAFAEGLRVLVKSINTEAGLTPQNEVRYGEYLSRLLVNRLRMQRDLVRYPEILDEEILPPLFITSLPRTGSTKLHRMLAASGNFHAMKFWQAHNFAPFPETDPSFPDPRLADAEAYLTGVWHKSPLYMAAHPMYHDEVEEERLLLDAGFNTLYDHVSYLNVPSYIEYVFALDPHDALRDLRHMLQYLQWQHFPGLHRRWVLKTPALLGREDTLAKVFPGTDFIVTHRHPEKVIASACTLFCGARAMYNDGDLVAIAGEYALYGFGEAALGHLHWRDTASESRVLDVRFDDVMADEHGVLSRVHKFLGLRYDSEAMLSVDAWLSYDAARHKPAARFSLSDYGLDAAKVNARFEKYIERYAEFL